MSFYIKTPEINYLSSKEKENFLLSDDDDEEDYNFKHIIKDVRRHRCREDEERVWNSFVKQQELNNWKHDTNGTQPSVQSIKELLHESMKEVDRELKRLEEDAVPEQSKRCTKHVPGANAKNNLQMKPKGDSSPKKKPIMKDSGTGSTNILLTIPEEEIFINERLQENKPEIISKTRKSSSDHTITKRRLPLRDYEYESSPETSTRLNDRGELIYIKPDPLVTNKILTMQRKIFELLNEISFRLNKIPLPDGDRDLKRRQQRVIEFSIRFSRNYLYDLNRYVADIQRHMCIIFPKARIKPNQRSIDFHVQIIEQKLIAAHQLLIHALAAYYKHIPTSILKGHPGKLKEVLQVVIELKDICDKIQITGNYFAGGDSDIPPLGREMQERCNALLSKLNSDNESHVISHNTQSTLSPVSSQKKKHPDYKNLSNRLSMYSMDARAPKGAHKKRLNQQKEKLHPVTNIKGLSTNYSLIPKQPNPSPVTNVSSKEVILKESTKSKTQGKEDDIKTVMDAISLDSDNGSSLGPQDGYSNMIVVDKKNKVSMRRPPILRDEKCVVNNDENLMNSTAILTEEHLSNLVPVIADFMSFIASNQSEVELRSMSPASVLELLQKYQSIKNLDNKIILGSNEDRRSKTLENMQLICISSEENVPRYCDASCQANCDNLKNTQSREMKIGEDKKNGSLNKTGIKLVIPEPIICQFLEYKSEYQKQSRLSPMYSSNTQNKPWDIVIWIADKLVDELIIEIAKELQMDEVIQKLFELEFHEF